MAKIRITRPQSTGTLLYGSLRTHSHFVSISIDLGNGGDHLHAEDDTGFKGASKSVFKRVVPRYDHSRPSYTQKDRQDPETGEYKIGWLDGFDHEDAPEVEDHRKNEVIEVHMSFEQFAEMLCSTGCSVDCTVNKYRPVGEEGVHYREVVSLPSSIYDRAKRRLSKTQEAALEEIDLTMEDLEEAKATQKVKDMIRSHLERIETHLIANAGFVVEQANREISSIAESAQVLIMEKVATLVAEGKLPPEALAAFHGVGSFLPAPEEE